MQIQSGLKGTVKTVLETFQSTPGRALSLSSSLTLDTWLDLPPKPQTPPPVVGSELSQVSRELNEVT